MLLYYESRPEIYWDLQSLHMGCEQDRATNGCSDLPFMFFSTLRIWWNQIFRAFWSQKIIYFRIYRAHLRGTLMYGGELYSIYSIFTWRLYWRMFTEKVLCTKFWKFRRAEMKGAFDPPRFDHQIHTRKSEWMNCGNWLLTYLIVEILGWKHKIKNRN